MRYMRHLRRLYSRNKYNDIIQEDISMSKLNNSIDERNRLFTVFVYKQSHVIPSI